MKSVSLPKNIIKYHHPNGCVEGAVHVFVEYFLGGGIILFPNLCVSSLVGGYVY